MDEETYILLEQMREVVVDLADTLEQMMQAEGRPPEGHPPQPPPEPEIDAKRLDRIWKYLQGWITVPKHEELQAWAIETFGYKYYVTGQKYPVEMKDAVCQKLRDFTDPQLTELEKILEAED